MPSKVARSQIEGATQGATRESNRPRRPQGARSPTRRTRSPHPGVVLKAPTPPRTAWRARFTDPDLGREAYVSLDPLGAGRNEQSRRRWAIEKARALAKRRDELALGAPRATGTALEAALRRYYDDHPRLRERTRSTYQKGTDKLTTWCRTHSITSADKLTLANLVSFRSWLSGQRRVRAAPGGVRGKKIATAEPRSPSAVNVEIRSVKAVLRYLRSAGLLPRLSRDDIAEGLKLLSTEQEAPHFLRTAEIKALLKAARQHDAATYKITRAEHKGVKDPGSTPRYDPIAPLVAVALLSGMRFGEIASLDWSEVDLQEGEIRLTSRTKTKRARAIDMSVSPALGKLLTALHEGEPKGPVWSLTTEQIRTAAMRLSRYGAPEGWSFQALRRTCGTYLTNSPGIFGAASAYRSARQLGHSVAVAEKNYLGVVKVSKDAANLEEAMGVTGDLGEVVSGLR